MMRPYLQLALLCTVSLLTVQDVFAQSYTFHPEPLQPRIEAGAKAGTERNIGMMEGWMPLAQDDDSVLYGDIRWMADSEENQEGNLGLGYRAMVNDKIAGDEAIVGVHGWIDRRRTDRGSNFHQITTGIEYLKEDWDVKANAYVPLNKQKEYLTNNAGNATPYLSGTGIFIDSNGQIIEEAQPGADIEVGYRIPAFEQNIDAIRIYGGGYSFKGDLTDDVVGGRVRTSIDINPLLNVGARFQYDEPRGSQGFLEATLRFPFTAKKRFQKHGLRARLDESPERDIDIVTNATVTDSGLRKDLINTTTGQVQRVLHVDNTAANGGDGSVEKPFNTLVAAQSMMADNDIIYINRGNGTTSGLDQGITVDKNNVQLLGSGSAFEYEGYTLRNAGLAPVLTSASGSTIIVDADKANIRGLDITDPDLHGIFANANGVNFSSIVIDDVNITTDNTLNKHPIWIVAQNGGSIQNATVTNVTADSGIAIEFIAQANSTINNIDVSNVTTTNLKQGILLISNGTIGTATLSDLSLNNGEDGIHIAPSVGGVINNVTIDNLSATGNTEGGVRFYAETNGSLGSLDITNSDISGNRTGVDLRTYTGSNANDISITNVTMDNNAAFGLSLESLDSSTANNISVSNSSANNNGQQGVLIKLDQNGTVDNLDITDTDIQNNTQNGIYFLIENSSTLSDVSLTDLALTGNGQNGFRMYNAGSLLNGLTLTAVNASGNTGNGLSMYATGASSAVNSVVVSGSDFTANGDTGVYLDQNAGTAFQINLGGTGGNPGQNRFFGNTTRELFIYLNGGGNVSARSNWWGNVNGLQPGRVQLFPGVNLDSTSYLTTDPRP